MLDQLWIGIEVGYIRVRVQASDLVLVMSCHSGSLYYGIGEDLVTIRGGLWQL